MQTFYIGNSLLGDELVIAQELISDILTCFGADVLDRAPLVAEVPHMGASCSPMGGALAPQWEEHLFYGGGKRCPIGAPHRGAPQDKFGALLKKNCPP